MYKPIECPHCGRCFTTYDRFQRHLDGDAWHVGCDQRAQDELDRQHQERQAERAQ